MKTILAFIIFCPVFLLAQEKLNSLKAPTSPASGILGLQPTSILAPKSYEALETAIYSNFMNNYSPVIPNDFALEFTPYWTTNHGLSLLEYLYPKSKFDEFIRNSSFSIASTQNFQLGDSTATNALAFGYRTTFYFGNKADREKIQKLMKDKSKADKIYARISSNAYSLIDRVSIVKSKADFLSEMKSSIYIEFRKYESSEESEKLTNEILAACDTLPQINDTNHDSFVELFRNIVDKTTRGDLVFNEFKSYLKERQGLSVDIAYANILNFPTSDFGLNFVPRQSVWITPTYRFKKNLDFLKIMGVLRYEWYNQNYYKKYFPALNTYKHNTDYGFAIAAEFKKFSIQAEAVGRYSYTEILAEKDLNGNQLYRKENKSDFQCIGSFNYFLTDQIILTYSFGNQFEPITNPTNTLISKLSINFGFGAPTKNDIK